MLKTHEDDIVVEPDAPAEGLQIEEENDKGMNVPSQLWMASELTQLADNKMNPAVVAFQKDVKTQEMQEQLARERAYAEKTEFVARVSEKDAVAARGILAAEMHEKKASNTPKSAIFKTYGREYQTTEYKISKLGTSEPGNICPRAVVEPRVPVVKLRENLAGKELSHTIPKEDVNLESFTRVQDFTIYNKSLVQKCKTSSAPHACFQSPSRGEVAPNICKLTGNEEMNAQYRTKTPMRTDQRDLVTKDEHAYSIDQEKAATMCRTSLLKEGQLASSSPLKGRIYPPKQTYQNAKASEASWYLNAQDADILTTYADRRKQMLLASDRYNKRIIDMDDQPDGQVAEEVEHYQNIRCRMANEVDKDVKLRERAKSPWIQWGLPEKVMEQREREALRANKKVDAAQMLEQQRVKQQKQAAEVKRTEGQYFEQVQKDEAYRKKKMGAYYYPDESAAISPQREGVSQAPFNGYAGNARKFDLLKENKYVNENIARPLDMQLVAKLRRQSASDRGMPAGAKGGETIGNEYADALKKHHRATSSEFNRFEAQENTSYRPGTTPSYSTQRSVQSKAIPPSSTNMKNQDLSKQLPRSSPCRARNYVSLTRTENFLEVNRLKDKDVEEAEGIKFAFAADLKGLVKDHTGKDLSIQANQILMEEMGNRLKIMREEDAVIVTAEKPLIQSVNDLKAKPRAQEEFAKQAARLEPERTGQKNLMMTVTERQRRIKEENADTALTFEEMSREKVDQMAVNLEEGENVDNFKPTYILKQRVREEQEDEEIQLEDRVDRENEAFYSESVNKRPKVFTFAESGRERLSNKFVAETTTNISVGSASLLVENGPKLSMSAANENFFDYNEIINPIEAYKYVNGTKTLVKDLNVQDRNDHTRLEADATLGCQCDATYNPKPIDKIFGKKDKPLNFGKQVGRKKADLHVNDLQYDIKYGAVESRVCDMVNIGMESGKK